MCVYIYTCMRECSYVRAHTYKNTRAHAHVHIHMRIHTHTHKHMYLYIYKYIRIYLYTHTYVYIYMTTYVHIPTYVYIHIYIYTIIYSHTQPALSRGLEVSIHPPNDPPPPNKHTQRTCRRHQSRGGHRHAARLRRLPSTSCTECRR